MVSVFASKHSTAVMAASWRLFFLVNSGIVLEWTGGNESHLLILEVGSKCSRPIFPNVSNPSPILVLDADSGAVVLGRRFFGRADGVERLKRQGGYSAGEVGQTGRRDIRHRQWRCSDRSGGVLGAAPGLTGPVSVPA